MKISTTRYAHALRSLGNPPKSYQAFLQAHFEMPGKASTATKLAKAASYKSWRSLNLQYGRLANKIASNLGLAPEGLGLLVEFSKPASVTNEHWLLIMRPEFAKALATVGWVNEA